jgi:hypothetical protein
MLSWRFVSATLLVAISMSCNAFSPESALSDATSVHLERALEARSQAAQQAEFDAIVASGCDAVPSLVRHLGDNRRLPVSYIRLQNRSKDAFEAYRQYGPETVTDAVAAMLSQATGRDFGFIYNGASQSQRAATVAAWRRYARETPAEKLCSGG